MCLFSIASVVFCIVKCTQLNYYECFGMLNQFTKYHYTNVVTWNKQINM